MEYEDIVPELLEKIKKDFRKHFNDSEKIAGLYTKVRDGTATYAEANEFAIEAGEILAGTFKRNLSSAVLPDGKMYFNIADRIIPPMMEGNYDLVTDVTSQVQKRLNEDAGIGIKAIVPRLNEDRIDGIVNRVSSEELYDNVAWLLDEPIVNYSQSIVDDAIKTNAEFHAKSGMNPKIVRTLRGGCCDWCKSVSGVYSYPNVPQDVYRRHQRCKCTVDYIPGNGKVQNVHSKQWQSQEERDKIETRKIFGIKSLALSLAEHPKRLASFTPESLKKTLEKEGYEVKPLKQGSLKNIPFEDDGGYKVNFEDGGILQYHPSTKSHHGGEYYKIATGKGGRHRYDTNGNKKFD